MVDMVDVAYTNNPHVIAKQHKMTAVNSAIEVYGSNSWNSQFFSVGFLWLPKHAFMADSTLALKCTSFFILPRSESVDVSDRTDTSAWLYGITISSTSGTSGCNVI